LYSSGSLAIKLCFGLTTLSLIAAVGCGYGNGVNLSHPSGNYSNASVIGTYVYQIEGFSLSSGSPFREVGAFTADGAGHITAGSDDTNFNSGGLPVSYSGSYSIGSDGTGSITFNATVFGPVNLFVTLVNPAKIFLMEGNNPVDGAGVAELQDSSAAASTPNGTFVFRLHQPVSAPSASSSASDVGAVTIASGAVSGQMDESLGGSSGTFNLTGGSFSAPGALGRGTATFVDSGPFTTSLIYYTVNSGKIALLVSNAGAVGAGSAQAQIGAVGNGLSGKYAFGSSGETGVPDGVGTVGQFTATGAGGTGTIAGVEDVMRDGSYSSSVALSSCFSASSNGRVAMSNLSGSTCSGTTTQVFWMISPSRAFFLNESAGAVEDGVADLQTTNSFSASTLKGQFAMVMNGVDSSGEVLARIGPLQFDGSSRLALTELVNPSNSGVTSPGPLSGNYNVSANGRVQASLGNSSLNLVMYAVSGSDAYVLQVDSGTNTAGEVSLQH